MSDNKNIDKLFKEQLKNFEVAPNDAIWKNIEQELHKDKRKRRIIPIWWKVVGVAAVLALLFTVSNSLFNNEPNNIESEVVGTKTSSEDFTEESKSEINVTDLNTSESLENNPVVDTENNSENENEVDSSKNELTTSKEENKNNNIAVSEENKEKIDSSKKSSVIKNKSLKKNAFTNTDPNIKDKTKTNLVNDTKHVVVENSNDTKPKINENQEVFKKENSKIDELIKGSKNSNATQITAANISSEKGNNDKVTDTTSTKETIKAENAIEAAIAETEKEEDETEHPIERWSIAPNVAPVYFNALGKGSPLDNQFVDNAKEGDVNVSYGIKGGYVINKKLKIRAGINKVDLGYSTNNILAFNGTSTSTSNLQLKNVSIKDNSSTFISTNSTSFSSGPEILFTREQSSISQQLGFIEIPLELEYNIVDKKIGLNLIGGFSTLFLNNNEIYSIKNNGDRTFLGEATNINDTSYSANLGIGVNYNISKKLRFNLEPTFKYQINTFNDISGDFRPFFIGVYTGLSFKF